MTTALPTADTTALDLVVDALAAYRLTLLVTTDTITEPARETIGTRWPDSKLDVLVNCPWCAGVWVGVGVAVARAVAPRAWNPLARGLALAAMATNLQRRL